ARSRGRRGAGRCALGAGRSVRRRSRLARAPARTRWRCPATSIRTGGRTRRLRPCGRWGGRWGRASAGPGEDSPRVEGKAYHRTPLLRAPAGRRRRRNDVSTTARTSAGSVARILLEVRVGDEHVGGHRIEITSRAQIRTTRRVVLPGPVIAAHELPEPDQVGS